MSGFDCNDYYLEHCFLVQVPTKSRDTVDFFEVFGRQPGVTEKEWSPEVVLRAQLDKAKWDAISGEVRLEFNRRLKAARRKPGKWSQGANGVQRLLGKELVVLVWAIEQDDVSTEMTEVAMKNWLGLKPEERWWLYTMTAASTGFAHQVGMGWRDALRKALCFGTRKDIFSLGALTTRGRLPPRVNDGHNAAPDADRRKIEFAALRAIGLAAREAFA
ncbi:DUF3780 domain-containing protein [Methylocystis sp. JAN1]|uniref:DUF3780 domain-containing protein n=1 Tax=Methylocystis sp. JAN1 TaxID=3397211 RepID=UPI003FA27950